MLNNCHPEQFHYDLPTSKIAIFPLEDRASSRLLVYKNGEIKHKTFREISDMIPKGSLLVFNDTKVIPARIIFHRVTGARIEVFLLEPLLPYTNMEQAMEVTGSTTWKCLIGNAKKWKLNETLTLHLSEQISLEAKRVSENEVAFRWDDHLKWTQMIEMVGKLPLPPYLNREADESDKPRYQTVYSKMEGAVAAPTAGLHFTPEVLDQITKNHETDFVTLHVSAGTFQPITTNAAEHPMHREQVIISKKTVEHLLGHDSVVAVGTTSMRTLESLYWYGYLLKKGQTEFFIRKETPYQAETALTKTESLIAVLQHMESHGLNQLVGHTEIMIVPGYRFRMVDALITNFHLPGTTLMMLVASFVGDDWRKIYNSALTENYRFLSYGDSSLLFRQIN